MSFISLCIKFWYGSFLFRKVWIFFNIEFEFEFVYIYKFILRVFVYFVLKLLNYGIFFRNNENFELILIK